MLWPPSTSTVWWSAEIRCYQHLQHRTYGRTVDASQSSRLIRRSIGVRSGSMLASSAFLASAAGTRPLQTLLLQKCNIAEKDINASLINWTSLGHTPANLHECSQRVWVFAVIDQSFQALFNSRSETQNLITAPDCWLQLLFIALTGFTPCSSQHAVCV
jgi:hypothetical protein